MNRALIRLLIALLFLLLVPAARAQDEVGPAAVFVPDDTFEGDLLGCSPADGCTLSSLMAARGASPEAVAFTQARDNSYYLSAFTELGRVDLGLVTMPNTASGISLYEMLNGNPSPVSADEEIDVDAMRALPAYAALWARHPEIVLWAQTIFDGAEARPDGGQQFLFSYPMLDGCRACPEVDKARAAFDFDAAGNFLGITYLDPASVAPAAIQPEAEAGSTSTLGQIAYTAPAGGPDNEWGNIWIFDLDTSRKQQVTDGGSDCCAAWSPDGTRLYFIRTIDGEAAPHSMMELDMITGEERAIGPETTLGYSLAVSPDGQTLAFVTNYPMPLPPPDQEILVDNMACLNLLDLGSGDTIEIDCLEQSFMGGLEFNPHEPNLVLGVGGMEWAQIYVYDLFPSEPTAFQGVCCFEPDWSQSDIRLYTLTNDNLTREIFNAAGVEGWAIVEQGQGIPSPLLLLYSADPIGSFDLSPDGQMVAFEQVGQVIVAMLRDQSAPSVYLADGVKPMWRPGEPAGWAAPVAAEVPDSAGTPEPAAATTPAGDLTTPAGPGAAATGNETTTPPAPDAAEPAAVEAGAAVAGSGAAPSGAELPDIGTQSPASPSRAARSSSDSVLIGIIVVSAAAALFGLIGYLTRRKA